MIWYLVWLILNLLIMNFMVSSMRESDWKQLPDISQPAMRVLITIAVAHVCIPILLFEIMKKISK